MESKEKAIELVEKFTSFEVTIWGCGKDKGNPCIVSDKMSQYDAKLCALIALEFAKTNYGIPDDFEEIESIKNEIIKL